jgi:hypothetical protein
LVGEVVADRFPGVAVDGLVVAVVAGDAVAGADVVDTRRGHEANSVSCARRRAVISQ